MGGHGYTVTATGGASGNPVTFSSGTPGVCTVTGSTVTLDHAGTCTVDADQAGDADYQAAPTAGQSFAVGKDPQSITFTSTAPADARVGGPAYTVTATGGGSGNPVTFSSGTPGVCTVTGATVTLDHAGTCTIDADQAGDADYQAAPTAGQSFAVGKDTAVDHLHLDRTRRRPGGRPGLHRDRHRRRVGEPRHVQLRYPGRLHRHRRHGHPRPRRHLHRRCRPGR